MNFRPADFGPDVAGILALDGNGQRLFPLTCGPCTNAQARAMLKSSMPKKLFPNARDAEAAMSGLWLYFSCFEEAHQVADACKSIEGEFWHAIVHRQEPDSGNAAYWFRRVGAHPIFERLSREVREVTRRIRTAEFRGHHWDPYAFISFCDRARMQPGSSQEQAAMEIQRLEWQILFDYCARPAE
jgi:hypothetical protein